ncbi:MAG: alpha-L-rhamnosidase C-terminal domain-containing protein [Bacteroidota bacterium]
MASLSKGPARIAGWGYIPIKVCIRTTELMGQDGVGSDLAYFADSINYIDMRVLLYFFGLTICFLPLWVAGQELNVPAVRYTPSPWRAVWITHPDISGNEYAVVNFRKDFQLDVKPSQFIISVSADNKYVLYVNGHLVARGPQLSDIRHWRYETIDIASFLQEGQNVIAAEVVNFGPDRFFGQQSYRTAFILNGITAAPESIQASIVNTSRGTWKTFLNTGVSGKEVRWRTMPRDIIGGFYASNPTDSVNAAAYPWGWEQPSFNAAAWKDAAFCENASAFGGGFGWILEPRNTPIPVQRQERLASVAVAEGIQKAERILRGEGLTIPANASVRILIDNKVLTTGYPEFYFDMGKDAVIRIGYAENLFLPNSANKGNRNEYKGMQFVGIRDVIVADGGKGRKFIPTWMRTFRFIELKIQTGNEPLVIRDFFNMYTSTPIPMRADFKASDPVYEKIFDLCRRTVALCTQDYFLSDAYYETMQYVGDTKVHAPVWQAFSGNDLHTRNALEQFHYSRLWDGNLTSCYPLRSTFVHPTYSVIWVDMLYDYLVWSGDSAFIRKFVPGIHHTLSMFDALIQDNGLAGATRWDYFVDWYQDSERGGLAPGQDGSNSAVVTLHYVHALQSASRILAYLGARQEADKYLHRSKEIAAKVYNLCFDPSRRLLAERPDKSYFDQHTNILGILTDAIPQDQQRGVLERILEDSSLGQATYYYRFYLFEALRKVGAGDLFDKALEPWKDLVRDGLTTALERMESPNKPTRSECHPWSTGPAYAYYTLIAGITPADIGFGTIRFKPELGTLNFIEGAYPHPKGDITFSIRRKGKSLVADITLPEGVSGVAEINNKTLTLKSGRQTLQ